MKNRIHAILHRNLVDYKCSDLFGLEGRAILDSASCQDTPGKLDFYDRAETKATLTEIDRINESVQDVEMLIAAFIVAHSAMLTAYDRLVSIPGVSLVVAAGLIAAIGTEPRFKNAKRFAWYFGIVPSTYQSGDSKAYHGRITKAGRSQARWLLMEAAEHLRKALGRVKGVVLEVIANSPYGPLDQVDVISLYQQKPFTKYAVLRACADLR